MSTRVIVCLALLFLGSSALGQEADTQLTRIPLSEVPIDFYSLKKWGVKHYNLFHFRKKEFKDARVAITERMLYPVARTPLETRIDGDKIVMRDYWRDQESKVSRTLVECHCNLDNHLSLQKMVVRFKDEVMNCDVSDGRYELTFLKRTRAGDWPKDTVVDAALLRLVTLLPRIEGAEYTFGHWSPTPQLNVRPLNRDPIRCVGAETISIGGREMKCTKFIAGNIHTWVRADNVLARIEIPGYKILEIDE